MYGVEVCLWDLESPDINKSGIRINDYIDLENLTVRSDEPFFDFTPDGNWLILLGNRLFPLRRSSLQVMACRAVGRNFHIFEWQAFFPNVPYRSTCPDLPVGYGVEPID
jgi:hypothetical protein